MSEIIINVDALQETLFKIIPTDMVKLRYSDGVISLIPIQEDTNNKCPLLGIASDSDLTVEQFLSMTREDKILEGLNK